MNLPEVYEQWILIRETHRLYYADFIQILDVWSNHFSNAFQQSHSSRDAWYFHERRSAVTSALHQGNCHKKHAILFNADDGPELARDELIDWLCVGCRAAILLAQKLLVSPCRHYHYYSS
jgi:hypothetical protein